MYINFQIKTSIRTLLFGFSENIILITHIPLRHLLNILFVFLRGGVGGTGYGWLFYVHVDPGV